MPADIDFAGLLAELESRDGYSVPYEVRPVRVAAGATLQAAINAAIDSANVAAIERLPADPSWSSSADHGDNVFVAELAKGSMEAPEVRAWFEDFGRLLDSTDIRLRVRPVKAGKRPPNLDVWRHLPGPPTAFLDFSTTEVLHRSRVLPAEVVENTAADLISWSRTPASTLVLERGLTNWLCPFEHGPEQLRQARPTDEPQFGLWTYAKGSRRMRLARFSYDAKAVMQVLDLTLEPADQLAALLDGVRILAPYLDYAYVRPATAVTPGEYDLRSAQGLGLPPMEQAVASGRARHLLDRYIVDAYVAQILTTKHLERLRDLQMFEVTQIDPDHHQVLARNPGPWLAPAEAEPTDLKSIPFWQHPPMLTTPPSDVLTKARSELSDLLLTPNLVKANPPSWMTT